MSTDEQVTAIKTYLSAAIRVPVYDHDEAQKLTPLPSTYVVVYLSRRYGGNVRGDTRSNDLRRLQARTHAQTVGNARTIEDRICGAFEHKTVDVAGVPMHFAYETGGGTYDYEGGYYTDLMDFTTSV